MVGEEICCGMVCKMRNASLARILGVLLHKDHHYVPNGVREVQFTLLATKFSEIYKIYNNFIERLFLKPVQFLII